MPNLELEEGQTKFNKTILGIDIYLPNYNVFYCFFNDMVL